MKFHQTIQLSNNFSSHLLFPHPTNQQLFIPSSFSSSSYPTTFLPIYSFFIQLLNKFSSHLLFLHPTIQQLFIPSLFPHPIIQQLFIPSSISSSSYPTTFLPIYSFFIHLLNKISSHLLFLHLTIQHLFIPSIFSIQLFNNVSSLNMFTSNYLTFHPTIQLFLIQLFKDSFSHSYLTIFHRTIKLFSSSDHQMIFFIQSSNYILPSNQSNHFFHPTVELFSFEHPNIFFIQPSNPIWHFFIQPSNYYFLIQHSNYFLHSNTIFSFFLIQQCWRRTQLSSSSSSARGLSFLGASPKGPTTTGPSFSPSRRSVPLLRAPWGPYKSRSSSSGCHLFLYQCL